MSPVRANRLNDIVTCLIAAGGAGLTRSQIAKCLGIKKTPYLNDLCENVVNEGFATKTMDYEVYPPVYRYMATDKLKSIA